MILWLNYFHVWQQHIVVKNSFKNDIAGMVNDRREILGLDRIPLPQAISQ